MCLVMEGFCWLLASDRNKMTGRAALIPQILPWAMQGCRESKVFSMEREVGDCHSAGGGGGEGGGAEGVGQLYYGLGASAVDEWKIRLH